MWADLAGDIECQFGSVADANSLAHSPWGIARTRMNSGVEQKQRRRVLFGHSYLQHIRFLLLVDDTEVPAKEAAKHLRDSFSDVVELRPSRNPGLRLVRPDGCVAYSAHNGNSTAALGSVRSLLERETVEAPVRYDSAA